MSPRSAAHCDITPPSPSSARRGRKLCPDLLRSYYLPPKQKAILELRMNDNLSYEEIAGILDRSVSTIKSSVFFALTKLKKMVQQQAAL